MGEIIQAIIKEYGEDSYVHYYGLTSQEERQDNIRKFQNDPKCRFLVGTPQTGIWYYINTGTYCNILF